MPKKRNLPRTLDDVEPDRARILAEKLRILRLLRALDRAGMDPAVTSALRVPLVRLAEIDALLASVLEVVDREGPGGKELGSTLSSILNIAEATRGDVVDALDGPDREAVRRAVEEVQVSEADIWMEVEALRKEARGSGKGAPRRPLSDGEAARVAEETWGKGEPGTRPEGQARVRREEARSLPGPRAPLSRWFARMPDPWREVAARIHDVPHRAGKEALAERLARRVGDAAWLRRFLVERLGQSEREVLGGVSALGDVALDTAPQRLVAALEVSWDWHGTMPPSSGGKLRGAGLVHVGTRDGERVAAIPDPLRAPLADALAAADPDSAAGPERAVRQALAESLDDTSFGDDELDRWKAIDRDVTGLLESWALEPDARPVVEAAVDAVFERRPRVVRSPLEQAVLFQFAILDWRPQPDAPTLAETKVARTRFDTPDAQVLAEATVAARPRLYRIAAVHRALTTVLRPLFPPGDDVLLTDRGLSLTGEVGWVVGARVYPAGPYHFARLLGDAIRPEREIRCLRSLNRALRNFVRAGGENDPAALIRARPEVLLRTLRAQVD